MKIYAIDELYYKDNHAGYKARRDIYDILKKNFSDIIFYDFYHYKLHSEKNRVKRVFLRILKLKLNSWKFSSFLKKMKEGDTIIIRYPFETTFPTALKVYHTLSMYKKMKKINIIFIVLDLDSVRRNGQLTVEQESGILSNADIIIPHNGVMSEWFIENRVIKEKLIDLQVFDYLSPKPKTLDDDAEKDLKGYIVFAGNLSKDKSKFLYHWKTDFNVSLYGINFDHTLNNENFEWKGVFDADEPVIDSSGMAFGLVWDGNSTETCEGLVGDYMRMSTPHKISLYLSQEIPVIIWKESALAEFVLKYHLGFVVNQLNEISDILSSTSPESYQIFKNNVQEVGMKLRDGYFSEVAISKAFVRLNRNNKDLE
ncbi:hypothetical protein [Elizabethkingia anophelis]|uniref:hypothetical protein n=2 Tax=Elizabethkingia anophelis TaxID=1117645 RepID=UPI000442CB40|nr:hypothetical protein [Elizabethkingia anophelis]EJC8061690.1 hypothetical protein [Elizabethkingia anophelis]MCL1642613.1 hypothetical protein [Elizabethkingia anophelis]MCL1645862.1 hypothetical protein [Elizabethkingia anophelis]MCT3927224.1 hypothetical protein [Elizabethkingia anophelis]MCT4035106.1 hypothetical protein [Elizabethkingia anophelis]